VSKRLRFPLLAVIPIAALCLCASASAAVITVGSPLAGPMTQGECTPTGGCTIANLALVAPGPPLTSPVSGAIISWRLQGATPVPGYAIGALSRGAGSTFTATASSAAVTPLGGGIETFGADVPIKAGEYIALDAPAGGGIDADTAGGQFAFLSPTLAAGQSGSAMAETGEIAFDANVLPPPTLGAISPATGSSAGGTSVVIAGSDFAAVKGVAFGALAAAYTVDSEGQITAVAPATGSAGGVDVTVTTAAGASPTSGADRFTYTAPAPAPMVTPPSIGPTARGCVVPKLTGKKLKLVKKKIRFAHCRLGLVSKEQGVGVETGKVVRQVPKAGKVSAAGTKVSVKLG
jgi:IPT/TIG domain/PASTA domain